MTKFISTFIVTSLVMVIAIAVSVGAVSLLELLHNFLSDRGWGHPETFYAMVAICGGLVSLVLTALFCMFEEDGKDD